MEWCAGMGMVSIRAMEALELAATSRALTKVSGRKDTLPSVDDPLASILRTEVFTKLDVNI